MNIFSPKSALARTLVTCHALAVSLSGVVPAASSAEPSQPPTRILWLGSSSMYYQNQPKLAAEWVARTTGLAAKSEIAGKSGTGVHVYLRDDFKAEYGLKASQTMLDKIRAEKFNFVVLQIPAEFINGPEGDEHDRSLDFYCKAIREAGGEPVFYEMGWGQDEKAEIGRQKILAAAVRNKVTRFAPCSSAWKRVRLERPDLDLHNPPDTVHPGTLGCYLNLCCFHAALTGKQPKNMPRNLKFWPKLSDEEKQAAAEKVKATAFDEYDAALPGWLKRLVVCAKDASVPNPVADYLERIAWEEYQSFQPKLVRK